MPAGEEKQMIIQDNKDRKEKMLREMEYVRPFLEEKAVFDGFYRMFEYRFCWASNYLEGNTLSLDETITVVDFDEVNERHTFSEYQDAKNLYRAIKLLKYPSREITEDWLMDVAGRIKGTAGEYRHDDVVIGNMLRVAYTPPTAERVPELMKEYLKSVNAVYSRDDAVKALARDHIRFERIHPFHDGNGRTGRMVLNQQLMNAGFLPISQDHTSKYRQAFVYYDKNEDTSLMEYLIYEAERSAIAEFMELYRKYESVVNEPEKRNEHTAKRL